MRLLISTERDAIPNRSTFVAEVLKFDTSIIILFLFSHIFIIQIGSVLYPLQIHKHIMAFNCPTLHQVLEIENINGLISLSHMDKHHSSR